MSQNKSVEEVVDIAIANLIFSGLSIAQMEKIPKWLLENIENNKSDFKSTINQTSQEREREIVENTAKSVNRIATQNGYALAIKHFEERMSKGQAVFEAIDEMKRTHRKQSLTNPNKD